tara:strand:+ start:761 stop:1870 length:1110 start_codon:yes stop_codon:yes gene_type:complete
MIYNNHSINSKIWEYLVNLKDKDRIPNALLFHGYEGSGKEACSIEFASLINCDSISDDFACGECRSCNKIINNNHEFINYIFPLPKGRISRKKDDISKAFNEKTLSQYNNQLKAKLKNPYHQIKIDGANTILINSIRSLKKNIYTSIDKDQWRIIIIWEAEKLCIPNNEAANSILKILEEPPARTIFIVVTSKEELLLDTIKSRCLSLFFPKTNQTTFDQFTKISADINLYKLLNGNIKSLELINEQALKDLSNFIKYYSQIIKTQDEILSMKLISNLSNLEKETLKLYIESIRHYYNDLAKTKINESYSDLTFNFLLTDYKSINNKCNLNWNNAINIIDKYNNKQPNQNETLFLINLFNKLGKHLKGH